MEERQSTEIKNIGIYPGKPNREKPSKPSYRDNNFYEQREERENISCRYNPRNILS